MKLTGYQARMLLRRYEIPVPEDLTHGETEQTYQIDPVNALRVAIITDFSARCPVLQISQPSTTLPAPVYERRIDVFGGLHIYQIHAIASEIDFPGDYWQALVDVCRKLYRCYTQSDAIQIEIKPLALTGEGNLLALNAHILLDDNARYRQPTLEPLRDPATDSLRERLAREAGMHCVTMSGQIGCLVNGAGLAMATMDAIDDNGADDEIGVASFIEIESGDPPEQYTKALGIILSDDRCKALLINIFAGLTRCDDVADKILTAFRYHPVPVPIIVRLQGTNASEGRRILDLAHIPGLICTDSISEAAWQAVAAVKRSQTHVHSD